MNIDSGLTMFIEKRLKNTCDTNGVSPNDKYVLCMILSVVGKESFNNISHVLVFNMCRLQDDITIKNHIKMVISFLDGTTKYHEIDVESVTNVLCVNVYDMLEEFYKNVDFVEEFKHMDFMKKMGKHIVVGSIYNCGMNCNELFEICKISSKHIMSPKLLCIYDDKDVACIKENHMINNTNIHVKTDVRKELIIFVKNKPFYLYYTL